MRWPGFAERVILPEAQMSDAVADQRAGAGYLGKPLPPYLRPRQPEQVEKPVPARPPIAAGPVGRWFKAVNWTRPVVRAIVALAAAALVAGVVLLAWAIESRRPAAPQQTKSAPAEPFRKVEARTERAVLAEVLDKRGNDLSALPAFDLVAPFVSVDGITLLRGTSKVRLEGVEGPGGSDTCIDEAGARWACGLQARAALHNLLAGKSLSCRPRRSLGQDEMTALCSLGAPGPSSWSDRDLAFMLIELGWARPLDANAVRYEPYLAVAREKKLGLWRGNWTLFTQPKGN